MRNWRALRYYILNDALRYLPATAEASQARGPRGTENAAQAGLEILCGHSRGPQSSPSASVFDPAARLIVGGLCGIQMLLLIHLFHHTTRRHIFSHWYTQRVSKSTSSAEVSSKKRGEKLPTPHSPASQSRDPLRRGEPSATHCGSCGRERGRPPRPAAGSEVGGAARREGGPPGGQAAGARGRSGTGGWSHS